MKPINVIAVFNTIKEVKPLYATIDGAKKQITVINSIADLPGMQVFHCTISGTYIPLYFDGAKWWTD